MTSDTCSSPIDTDISDSPDDPISSVVARFTDAESGDLSAQDIGFIMDMVHPENTLTVQHIAATLNELCDAGSCHRSDLERVLLDLRRRTDLLHRLEWDFSLLDTERRGSIPEARAKHLFRAVHGKDWEAMWMSFASNRKYPSSLVSLGEMEIALCNLLPPSTSKR